MTLVSAETPPTQQRSLETRRVLIDATLDCLFQFGYSNTSTTKIIERAGTSRGAMLHHFPTRLDLITATYQAIHEDVKAEVRKIVASDQHWSDQLDVIFRAFFQGKQWEAFLEITLAARTDADLWKRVVPVVSQYYAEVDNVWHQNFATNAVDAEVESLLNLSLCVLRGMAVQSLVRDDPAYYEGMLRQFKAMIKPLISNRSGRSA